MKTNNTLTIPQGVQATTVSLSLPENMSEQQWLEMGRYLQTAGKSLTLWTADWLRYGKAKFSEEVVERGLVQMAFDFKERERLELQAEVLPEYRHDTLTPEHYLVAAKRLDNDKDREKWLFTAASEKLTPRELQASIRAHEVVRIDMGQRSVSFPSPYAVQREFKAWRKELGDAWEKWSAQDCRDVADALKDIAEFYHAIKERAGE